ncbi:MAG: DUF1634 domain-containing protein [Candidatus Omnitrophica bacterium]|nr:DUF1634 domain-containing protein [Candidatus Omnitrophota bacterium]MDE2221460.1 DUF1634 domain-containing protein [Candidatus Omnitrophota bacterium]
MNDMEKWIGGTLRGGVAVAGLLVLAGGAMYLTVHGAAGPAYGAFKGEPERLKDIGGIVHAARALHPRGIIQLGLLCLIATPIMRVILSIVIYARQKDKLYMIITGIVLCLLLYSLVIVR